MLELAPQTDARVPYLEHREGVYQRQVSSKVFRERGLFLHTSVLSLTSDRGNMPLETLKLKYYLTFGTAPIPLQEYFAIISVQQTESRVPLHKQPAQKGCSCLPFPVCHGILLNIQKLSMRRGEEGSYLEDYSCN